MYEKQNNYCLKVDIFRQQSFEIVFELGVVADMAVVIFFRILARSHIEMLTEGVGEKTVIVPTAKHGYFPDRMFAKG